MAEIQTMMAAYSIAELAFKTSKLIRRVIQARTDADALYHRMKHLRSLADRIGRVLKSRQKDGPSDDPIVVETVDAIKETLDECHVSLTLIDKRLDPLADPGTGDRPPDFGRRISFVCSTKFITCQQDLIKTHIDNLTIDILLLQSLDQTSTLTRLKHLDKALVRNASAQRLALDDLGQPESDNGAPEPSRELSGDESEPEVDLSQRCQKCLLWKTIFPETPLEMAVKHREADRVRDLVPTVKVEELTIRDADDWTLLHHATHLVDYPTVTHILSRNEALEPHFLNAQAKDGATALVHTAAQADADDSYKIAHELVRQNCDVNISDTSDDNRTALWWAVNGAHSKHRERMVDLLVEHGATVTSVRTGSLQEQAKRYPSIEEAYKKEDTGRDGLGRRLTKVLTSEGG